MTYYDSYRPNLIKKAEANKTFQYCQQFLKDTGKAIMSHYDYIGYNPVHKAMSETQYGMTTRLPYNSSGESPEMKIQYPHRIFVDRFIIDAGYQGVRETWANQNVTMYFHKYTHDVNNFFMYFYVVKFPAKDKLGFGVDIQDKSEWRHFSFILKQWQAPQDTKELVNVMNEYLRIQQDIIDAFVSLS